MTFQLIFYEKSRWKQKKKEDEIKEKNRTEIAFTVRIMRKKLVMSISWNSFELVLQIAYICIYSSWFRIDFYLWMNWTDLNCLCVRHFFLFFFVAVVVSFSLYELGFVFKYDKLPFRSIDFINGSLRGVASIFCFFLFFCLCSEEITVIVSSLKYTHKKNDPNDKYLAESTQLL